MGNTIHLYVLDKSASCLHSIFNMILDRVDEWSDRFSN